MPPVICRNVRKTECLPGDGAVRWRQAVARVTAGRSRSGSGWRMTRAILAAGGSTSSRKPGPLPPIGRKPRYLANITGFHLYNGAGTGRWRTGRMAHWACGRGAQCRIGNKCRPPARRMTNGTTRGGAATSRIAGDPAASATAAKCSTVVEPIRQASQTRPPPYGFRSSYVDRFPLGLFHRIRAGRFLHHACRRHSRHDRRGRRHQRHHQQLHGDQQRPDRQKRRDLRCADLPRRHRRQQSGRVDHRPGHRRRPGQLLSGAGHPHLIWFGRQQRFDRRRHRRRGLSGRQPPASRWTMAHQARSSTDRRSTQAP